MSLDHYLDRYCTICESGNEDGLLEFLHLPFVSASLRQSLSEPFSHVFPPSSSFSFSFCEPFPCSFPCV